VGGAPASRCGRMAATGAGSGARAGSAAGRPSAAEGITTISVGSAGERDEPVDRAWRRGRPGCRRQDHRAVSATIAGPGFGRGRPDQETEQEAGQDGAAHGDGLGRTGGKMGG